MGTKAAALAYHPIGAPPAAFVFHSSHIEFQSSAANRGLVPIWRSGSRLSFAKQKIGASHRQPVTMDAHFLFCGQRGLLLRCDGRSWVAHLTKSTLATTSR